MQMGQQNHRLSRVIEDGAEEAGDRCGSGAELTHQHCASSEGGYAEKNPRL